jgi:hemerythrin
MRWDPGLATGIPEIDEQHRQVFGQLEAIYDAIRRGASRDELGRTLEFLRGHVARHFTAEEALMTTVGYPEIAAHRAEHEAFARDLRVLERDHQRAGASPGLVLRVSGQLATWLRDHVSGRDRALAEFIRARTPGQA